MSEEFSYDVFLSHSTKDKPIVREVAERLRADGLKVWFDEWVLKPGDNIPAKIEEGLEHSRVLVLCMSANAFGSDWTQLESYTFRFRDPLNKGRRFIPLRLDDAPIKGSLAQFLCINWLQDGREQEYTKLLEACLASGTQGSAAVLQTDNRISVPVERDRGPWHPNMDILSSPEDGAMGLGAKSLMILSGHTNHVGTVVVTPDGKSIISGSVDKTIRVWDFRTGQCRVIINAPSAIFAVAVDTAGRLVFAGSPDGMLRAWEVDSGKPFLTFRPEVGQIGSLVTIPGPKSILASGQYDGAVGIWDFKSGRRIGLCRGHTDSVYSVAASPDGRLIFSGSKDRTIRVWNTSDWRCVAVLEGHFDTVRALAVSPDSRYLVSGSWEGTLRIWDLSSWKCRAVLEGHVSYIKAVAITPDGRNIISGADDGTIRVWDFDTGARLAVLSGHTDYVYTVAVTPDSNWIVSGSFDTTVRIWPTPTRRAARATRYMNAKVLLVGESGVGKTGLSKRLVLGKWEASDSTVGAWATQWKLPVASASDIEREIWLWDFGGQADQRLIHQLYMDETALAVLVFDGQKEDLFETLGQWDRDLTRASRKDFAKLLVAGRVDAGGLRVSRSEVEKFAAERKFSGFLETSAKQGLGCEELKQAILDGINWDEIPCRTTEVLFKRLKEEIIHLKDEGRVLMRFSELREMLQLRLSGEFSRFTDEELHAVLTLLAGPGVVWELKFGSWVLLQPERVNAYAQAVIRTLQADEHQRGSLLEEQVLQGDLAYESSMPRLANDEERFVLLAMHQTLVERGLCLRQPSDKGNLLVFPSYYRHERPELVGRPAVLVSYRFAGFLDEIYATLVVRLHYTNPFQQDQLWRYAADFKTNTGKQLGVTLTRRAPGIGELEVYFDPAISTEEKIIFGKYIHEHLLQYARDVERLRHYVCPHCGTPVGNREVAMKRLNAWLQSQPPEPDTTGWSKLRKIKKELPSIVCVECMNQVPLWDEMEQCFANPEIQQRVHDMQAESAIVLDNESKERALVGEVISTVALAGQICREFAVSDHGIDMEIEFKDDDHESTGEKLYLQLKPGDAYQSEQKSDGTEVFTIKDKGYARYWMESKFPVLLVIRNAEGEVRWMDIRDHVKRASDDGKKPVRKFVFAGERFDVMTVRRWREKTLRQSIS